MLTNDKRVASFTDNTTTFDYGIIKIKIFIYFLLCGNTVFNELF